MRSLASPTLAAALLVLGMACTPGAEPAPEGSAGEWRGTIETEDEATTVRNEAGSVWGGTARLVEELAIGVEEGDEPYMFGSIRGLAADGDRIYVGDTQVPVVRAFDRDGKHLLDVGRRGEGPGEFQMVSSLALGPEGRIFVREDSAGRLVVFDADGEPFATYQKRSSSRLHSSLPVVVTADGTPHVPVIVERLDDEGVWIMGMQPLGLEGLYGEPLVPSRADYVPPQMLFHDFGSWGVPFSPRHVWAMTPRGEMLAGVSDAYRFERHGPDGSVLAVERPAVEVEVAPEEADYRRLYTRARIRRSDEDWMWPGDVEVPSVKPAFEKLIPALSGEIWVVRPGPAHRIEDCDEDPEPPDIGPDCWPERKIVDVFGADGRFLGDLELPEGLQTSPEPVIRDDTVVAVVLDDLGTARVKRYRLALPGEEER